MHLQWDRLIMNSLNIISLILLIIAQSNIHSSEAEVSVMYKVKYAAQRDLVSAIKHCNRAWVESSLELGADINFRNTSGSSLIPEAFEFPLSHATEDMFEWLLTKGAVENQESLGRSFVRAAERREPKAINYILARAQKQVPPIDLTPYFNGILCKIIKSYPQSIEDTPETIKTLIKAGLDINSEPEALHVAVDQSDTYVAKCLIDAGIKLDFKPYSKLKPCHYNKTALYRSISTGRIEIASAIIDKIPAEEIGQGKWRDELGLLLQTLEYHKEDERYHKNVKIFIAKGADISPLHYAVKFCDTPYLE